MIEAVDDNSSQTHLREKNKVLSLIALGGSAVCISAVLAGVYYSAKTDHDRNIDILREVRGGGGFEVEEVIKNNAYTVRLHDGVTRNLLTSQAVDNAMRSIIENAGPSCRVASSPSLIPNENKASVVINCQ